MNTVVYFTNGKLAFSNLCQVKRYEIDSVYHLLQAQPTQHSEIAVQRLSLSAASKFEVADNAPIYRQYINYGDSRLQLLTPVFKAVGLMRRQSGNNLSVLVPILPWMREQFDIVENYVKENVNLGNDNPQKALVYKPLFRGGMMYVRVAPWCNIMRRNSESNSYESVDHSTPLGAGSYSVTVEVPYAYIGSHKNGEDFSLTLRVVQIIYDPCTVQFSNLIQVPIADEDPNNVPQA